MKNICNRSFMGFIVLTLMMCSIGITAYSQEIYHRFSGTKMDFVCADGVLKQVTQNSSVLLPFPEDGIYPEIKREFDFIFYCGEEEERQVRIYPKNILEPLNKWSKKHTIRFIGDQDNLTNFLDKAEIEYLLPHEMAPEGKSALIINSNGLKKDETLPKDFNSDLVILINNKTQFDIEYMISSEQNFVEVEGNIAWDFDNPLHHKLLMKIFRRAL